ncbi:MAG TPA: HEAT repeat domain-containing protein, partial [bacterium]|nr:HEAT repeat domain-containing protein [bacterium]
MQAAVRTISLGLIVLALAPFLRAQPSLPPPLDRENLPETIYSRMRSLYSIVPLERGRAALALGDAGGEALAAVPYLKSMLDDDALLTMRSATGGAVSTSPGKEAARALARILAPGEALAVLQPAAASATAAIRAAAARGLAEMGDSVSYPILKRLLLDDPDPAVRASALSALDQIDTPRTADLLVGALDDPSSDVRKAAAYIVAGKRRDWLMEPLVGALSAPGVFARKTALEALGGLPDAEKRPELAAMLDDEDRGIRLAALAILGRNDRFPAGPVLNLLADPD